MSAYREWRERVAKAWRDEHDLMGTNVWRALANQPLMPPEVLELQRRYEEDTEQFWDIRQAGDQVAIDRNNEYHDDVARAAHRHGIHDLCSHHVNYEPPDNDEYMSPMGYAAEPVGVVWGTVNPDGSVTARGFTDNESYTEDSAVHPVGSLVAYHAEDNTWVHMATGQTVAKQREIDAKREAAVLDEREAARAALHAGDARPAMEFNRAHERSDREFCGGCIGAGTGKSCCMCGKSREGMQPSRLDAEQVGKAVEEYQQAKQDAAEAVITAVASTTTSAPTAGAATSSGGAGMSHASEGNAQIQQAGQDIESANGAIQEIVNQLTQAQQNLMGAADESQHAEADTAKAALEQAIATANELQQQVGAAKQAVEDVRL
jgi:hypothetical protein